MATPWKFCVCKVVERDYGFSTLRKQFTSRPKLRRRHLRPDMQVLEFGCGSGLTAISHAPFVRSIRGIDSASKMIAIANEVARKPAS